MVPLAVGQSRQAQHNPTPGAPRRRSQRQLLASFVAIKSPAQKTTKCQQIDVSNYHNTYNAPGKKYFTAQRRKTQSTKRGTTVARGALSGNGGYTDWVTPNLQVPSTLPPNTFDVASKCPPHCLSIPSTLPPNTLRAAFEHPPHCPPKYPPPL